MNSEFISIQGTVEDIVFVNSENSYTVFEFSTDDDFYTGVGQISEISVGERINMTGRWITHPSYGKQFSVVSCEYDLPKTAADMLRYLSSGALKGVRAKTATKIVERFGERTFDVIENYPEELSTLKGITLEKAQTLSSEFKIKFAVREVVMTLERYGMKASECIAAYTAFSDHVVALIRANPYILCGEKNVLSFARADEIASNIDGDFSDYRLRAGVTSFMRSRLVDGHTCVPRREVLSPAAQMLSVDIEVIEDVISDLISDKELMTEYIDSEDFLFLPEYYHAEKNIAERLKVMLAFPPPTVVGLEADIDKIESRREIIFEQKQRQAILTAVEKGLLVLTGGPGTGKTTILNGILDMYENLNLKVLLAAPTGRAAKRMTDVTGREAKTLHRLLEASFAVNNKQIFNRNVQNPLECDAVIIDELSMVDVSLFWGLLDALPLGSRLIMVGDNDQLPPVGPGNVLKDIIDSDILPVVALTEIFRQAQESLIITNAHRIVTGEMPVLDNKNKDFFFLERRTPDQVSSVVQDLFLNRLPNAYHYNSVADIQVICPSRKGELGTIRLNQGLQKQLNPPARNKNEYNAGGITYRDGDKVMQTKNNYDLIWINETTGKSGEGVFNGDIGIIETVNPTQRMMRIKFDERIVKYPFEFLPELELAYAVTVHKSQGSEFECVIMPIFGVNYNLAYRNLIYTAVTRAKSRIVLVGSKQQIKLMVSNNNKSGRYSALKHFIKAD